MISYKIKQQIEKTDLLVLPIFEAKKFSGLAKMIDEQLSGQITKLYESKEFEAKLKQTALLYTQGQAYQRVLLIGCGDIKNVNSRHLKQVLGMATLQAQSKKIKKLELALPKELFKKFDPQILGQDISAGIGMSDYAFDTYREKDARVVHISRVTLVTDCDTKQKKALEKGLEAGDKIAQAANFMRELGNTPPSDMTPTRLGKEAQTMGQLHKNLKIKVLGQTEIEKLKMGSFLAVAKGSHEEPKFIIMEFMNGKKGDKPTVLVGKGITFDSGGLSIKPANFMSDMKFDMLGAATVIGCMNALARLDVKKNVVGLVPACENMPGGRAYRPDDILTAMNGKTIEVKNTDAEGRLILCDALCYASRYEPKEVIDFATLTGACVVAIGEERCGLFSKEEKMVSGLLASAEKTGELLWRLPLGEEYSEMMKSMVADYSNISASRYAGASTAAAFLEFFTDYPWAHIDLSGSYTSGKSHPWMHVGANGFGVQTVVDYLA
ncbi:leucyl aminopeptidase [Candidatus Nomurabacteria bacterium]|nr:leucyl aminopeptidase [Candidatus Nomurabacteria bacterium]